MSLRNRLVLSVILSSLGVLSGCGGSSTNSATPPPSGAFGNTNFNGTYTFSVLGANINGGFAMAGSLTACGCAAGTISGGTVDLVDPLGAAPASAIGSASSYSISSDGRGFARLSISPQVGTPFEVDLDFVLTSSSHGMIIRYDGNGTGSGTIDLQSSAVSQGSLANTPYAFSLAGYDLAGDPLSQMGAFTLDSSGNISTSGSNAGVADTTLYNFSTFIATPFPNSALSGAVQVGSGTAPGTATLATSFGTLTFDVYAIDDTHLKLIESDGFEILVGDVFTQPSASIPQGNLVFVVGGPDPGANPFAAAGIVTSDGSSLLTNGSEDLNDNGVVDFGNNPLTPQSFSGSFAATGGGRFLVTLSTFAGGTSFAAYPSGNGLLLLEIDSGAGAGITSGVALAQSSGAALASSQGYGMNMSGVDLFNGFIELDEIAEFKTTTSSSTGLIDENDGGSLSTGNLSGGYTAGTGGLGSATFNTAPAGVFYYAADGSNVLVLSTDSGFVGLGSFEVQTAPTQSAMEGTRALAVLRSIPRPPAASARKKIGFVRK